MLSKNASLARVAATCRNICQGGALGARSRVRCRHEGVALLPALSLKHLMVSPSMDGHACCLIGRSVVLGEGARNRVAKHVANDECSHAAVGLAQRDKAANPHSNLVRDALVTCFGDPCVYPMLMNDDPRPTSSSRDCVTWHPR